MHQVIKSKSILRVVNANGRAFNLKVIEEGDRYGNNDCLTHDKVNDPLVTFYDAAYAGKHEGWEFGQPISRYYVRTLLSDPAFPNGLCLDGGVDVWTVDASAMAIAIDWLAKKTGFWQLEIQEPVEFITTTTEEA